MKRLLIKLELLTFGHCYCAVPRSGHNQLYHLQDLQGTSFAVPTRPWAERIADRRADRSGQAWGITKWERQ